MSAPTDFVRLSIRRAALLEAEGRDPAEGEPWTLRVGDDRDGIEYLLVISWLAETRPHEILDSPYFRFLHAGEC